MLDPWLPLGHTVVRYQNDGTIPGRFNLNGVRATPDGRYLLVVQTNTGQLFRIDVSTKALIQVAGEGNPGGDGLTWLSDTDLLSIDMTKSPTLTLLRLFDDWSRYEVVARTDALGNNSPTAGLVLGDRLLLTESQISEVLVKGGMEHLPFRVTVHSLSSLFGKESSL